MINLSTAGVSVSTFQKIDVKTTAAALNMPETMPRFDFGAGANLLESRTHKLSREMIAALATRPVVVNGTTPRRVVTGQRTVPEMNTFGVIYVITLVILPAVILLWRFAHILVVWRQGLSLFDLLRSTVGDVMYKNGVYIGDSVEYVTDLWHREKKGEIEYSKPSKSKAGLGVTDKNGSLQISVLQEAELLQHSRLADRSFAPTHYPADVRESYEMWR